MDHLPLRVCHTVSTFIELSLDIILDCWHLDNIVIRVTLDPSPSYPTLQYFGIPLNSSSRFLLKPLLWTDLPDPEKSPLNTSETLGLLACANFCPTLLDFFFRRPRFQIWFLTFLVGWWLLFAACSSLLVAASYLLLIGCCVAACSLLCCSLVFPMLLPLPPVCWYIVVYRCCVAAIAITVAPTKWFGVSIIYCFHKVACRFYCILPSQSGLSFLCRYFCKHHHQFIYVYPLISATFAAKHITA